MAEGRQVAVPRPVPQTTPSRVPQFLGWFHCQFRSSLAGSAASSAVPPRRLLRPVPQFLGSGYQGQFRSALAACWMQHVPTQDANIASHRWLVQAAAAFLFFHSAVPRSKFRSSVASSAVPRPVPRPVPQFRAWGAGCSSAVPLPSAHGGYSGD